MTDTNTSATLISNAHTYAKGAVALFLARVGLRTALTEREHDLLESMFALAYQEATRKAVRPWPRLSNRSGTRR